MVSGSKQHLKSALLWLLVPAMPCALFYLILGPAVPRTQLSKVHEGMSSSEVLRILGTPNEVWDSEGIWGYSRWCNPGWVEVAFSEEQTVAYVNDESVFAPRHDTQQLP